MTLHHENQRIMSTVIPEHQQYLLRFQCIFRSKIINNAFTLHID